MVAKTQIAAGLVLKVCYDEGTEKIIGPCSNLNFTVSQGLKTTYGVDSAEPVEIAQGAAASFVKGSLTLYLPKGSTLESMVLVPYRADAKGNPISSLSRYMHFRIYDRSSQGLVCSADWCKISSYTVGVGAKGIVQVSLSFDGMYCSPGLTI